jgi:septum formation topological specificity factor MinE
MISKLIKRKVELKHEKITLNQNNDHKIHIIIVNIYALERKK